MATSVVKEKSSYTEAFRALQAKADGTSPSWLKLLRESAMESFERTGFPTVGEEDWKYTNVAPIAKTSFTPAFERPQTTLDMDANRLEPFEYTEAIHSRLVFVNGIYHPNLSSLTALPEGVVALDLAEAFKSEAYAEVLREHLGRHADYGANAFNALNTALLSSGAFLFIPKGAQVETPIHLLFLSDPQAEPGISSPRVLVVAERESAATVIESYASVQDGVYLTNAVVEVVLEEAARLEFYKVQNESQQSFHVATTRADLGRNSSFNATTITLGAQLSRHDINVTMDEEGAECWVDGLYLVSTGQHADTHSLIDHRKPHCTSHQLYKGILDGKSRAVFNGKVFVRRDAQQTDAMQTNKNLLLSNDARVDTKPQLEIFADDVKCAHGAAIGQLDEEELFYLASRGMNTELARNLLTYGFAEEVIDKIKIETIKAQLDQAVLHRLHAQLDV
ncbi:MAG: Fe-S cluster assembly protein SufD [Pyrinomonadaceae bacterium]